MTEHKPWWGKGAAEFVAGHLRGDEVVFEWGSGGSSMWMKKRCGKLISIEHNPTWYRKVRMGGVDVRLISIDGPKYQDAIIGKGKFDWILVDGRKRVLCCRNAVTHLKPGGYLVFDDSQRERYNPALDLMADWEQWAFEGPQKTTVFRKPAPDEASGTDSVPGE